MELHPTAESWRIALMTAVGAFFVAAVGLVFVAVRGDSPAWLVTGILIGIAALATFVPALGALTAAVDADIRGVTIRRFGLTSRYRWNEVAGVRLVERRARVPDGTEYHWVVPAHAKHVVAVPCLELVDGRVRELTALAAPAAGARRAAAEEQADRLTHLRALTIARSDDQLRRVG